MRGRLGFLLLIAILPILPSTLLGQDGGSGLRQRKFGDETQRLVGGKVYGYFPSGVPMEGKQHLKGWQAPFGDIPETLFVLPREPAKIYEGRQTGLDKTIPPDEPIAVAVEYDGKAYEIKATVKYQLNPAYEAKP